LTPALAFIVLSLMYFKSKNKCIFASGQALLCQNMPMTLTYPAAETLAYIEPTLMKRAVKALNDGKLIAFPTETVYGLGADATNPDAMSLLYSTKGRPESHPVIVHIHDVNQLSSWARDVPECAYRLAEAFWPGPITLILKKADNVLDQVTGFHPTVGLRIPAHPVALELLRAFGGGVAAPSANRFGRLSPTRAEDVIRDLGADCELVLDGGQSTVGIESTIVDLTESKPRILRPGMLSQSEIEGVLNTAVESGGNLPGKRTPAPGNLASHYAPQTPVRLVSSSRLYDTFESSDKKACVLHYSPGLSDSSDYWLKASEDPFEYARSLYINLRILDEYKCGVVLVESPPVTDIWRGVRDRLLKAQGLPDNSEGEIND
jgi:L-threonylcarbamoyladenylate synthase